MSLPAALLPYFKFRSGAALVETCVDRCRQGALSRPAQSVKSSANELLAESKQIGPFSNGVPLTVEVQPGIAARIVGLLFRGCPSAILRGIWAVIVDPVDGMFLRWSSAHIGPEGFKRHPAFTDCNTSAAVSRIGRIGRVEASSLHLPPRAIFRREALPVRAVALACQFSIKTAAAFGFSDSKFGGEYDLSLSTVAETGPVSAGASWCSMLNRQTAESLASVVV